MDTANKAADQPVIFIWWWGYNGVQLYLYNPYMPSLFACRDCCTCVLCGVVSWKWFWPK